MLQLFLSVLFSIYLATGRHASEFSFSSSLVPLYLQNQFANSNSGISLDNSRLLQSSSSGPHVILITPSFPLTSCTIGNDTQFNFEGFHVDLFRSIAQELGWTAGTDYIFSCVSESELYNRVGSNNNATCGLGGIISSSDKTRSGIRFSQPITDGGLTVIIRRNDPRTIWSFLMPISLKIGLSFLGATFLCGIAIWFFEETNWKRPFKEHLVNFGEVMYDVFSSIYETNALELKKLSSRILQWTIWLLVVIFLSIYQADLTEKLSSTYVQKEFRSFQDAILLGKVFASPNAFKPLIKANLPAINNIVYYATPSLQESIHLEDAIYLEKAMIVDLEDRKIDGIILTNPLTEYYASQFCEIQSLDDFIGSLDYVLAFPSAADKLLFNNISQAITKLSETHRIQLLKNQYMRKTPNAECDSGESISVKELGGLWVILGVAIVVSVVIHFLRKLKVIVPLENYKPPYYTYYSQKTEIFESQLKEAVQFEINKILMTYKDQLMDEIEDFENTLLLQSKKNDAEKEV